MSSSEFAVTRPPVDVSRWAATQLQYDFSSPNEWESRTVLRLEMTPIFAITNVSFAASRGGQHESNYAESIKLPAWSLPLDDEQRSRVVGEILGYPKLCSGWDGSPEDIAPSTAAADQAATFVELLPPFVPAPEPSVASDGEVILFWKDQGLYVEVGFRGGETYSYFAERKTEKIKGPARVDEMFSSSDKLATFLIRAFSDGALHM